jgi:hypothetical protein
MQGSTQRRRAGDAREQVGQSDWLTFDVKLSRGLAEIEEE